MKDFSIVITGDVIQNKGSGNKYVVIETFPDKLKVMNEKDCHTMYNPSEWELAGHKDNVQLNSCLYCEYYGKEDTPKELIDVISTEKVDLCYAVPIMSAIKERRFKICSLFKLKSR